MCSIKEHIGYTRKTLTGVRPKRRARTAAAGPGLWKLCEQQSRRQVRGLIDFRHPLSFSLPPPPLPATTPLTPVPTRGSHCTEAERFTPNQSPSASIPKNTPRRVFPSRRSVAATAGDESSHCERDSGGGGKKKVL